MELYIIAASRGNYERIAAQLEQETGHRFVWIRDREQLRLDKLAEYDPKKIFFPHWSYMIPEEVYSKYECVIFHMTDVPFGRGGSPLQNLISRGVYETKISAIRCVRELDAGPVYMKAPLSLHGTAEEILLRAADVIHGMIYKIIAEQPEPNPQTGEPVVFRRRTKEQGNISSLRSLREVYDFIRMLDAEGYPRAYLETEHFIFEFERASLKQDEIIADVRIRRKEEST